MRVGTVAEGACAVSHGANFGAYHVFEYADGARQLLTLGSGVLRNRIKQSDNVVPLGIGQLQQVRMHTTTTLTDFKCLQARCGVIDTVGVCQIGARSQDVKTKAPTRDC